MSLTETYTQRNIINIDAYLESNLNLHRKTLQTQTLNLVLTETYTQRNITNTDT